MRDLSPDATRRYARYAMLEAICLCRARAHAAARLMRSAVLLIRYYVTTARFRLCRHALELPLLKSERAARATRASAI